MSGLNLRVAFGEKVAEFGTSGAGKSTLVQLLFGLRNPAHGKVRVGTGSRTGNGDHPHETLGYASSNPFLLHASVRDNLCYGNPNASSDAMVEAARLAGAIKFILSLPEAGLFALRVFKNELSTYPSLVAAGHPEHPGLLPASLPGVYGVIADNEVEDAQINMHAGEPYPCRARGVPRKLDNISPGANLNGHSLACARVTAYVALALDSDPIY